MEREITDEELATWAELAGAATAGPWHERWLDDTHAAGLVAVSTAPDTGEGEKWPAFNAGEIVAGTLIQFPVGYVNIADHRWDENARFIAAAREAVPRLIDEVRRLRALLAGPDTDHAG